jgi:hypothetical protein
MVEEIVRDPIDCLRKVDNLRWGQSHYTWDTPRRAKLGEWDSLVCHDGVEEWMESLKALIYVKDVDR